MKEIAIVLSAGVGKRFGSVSPKQFIMLKSRPVMYYSLKVFQETPWIDSILLVSHKYYFNKTKLISASFNKVSSVIEGGERRQDSVWNALEWIASNVEGCTKVYIHDAARPVMNNGMLDRLHDASMMHPAVIPIIPVEDTIKKVSDAVVSSTVNRSEIYRVQTPQVFDYNLLYKAYKSYPAEKTATDDASIIEHYGQSIYTVEGSRENIKITYPIDIKIAETLIVENQLHENGKFEV